MKAHKVISVRRERLGSLTARDMERLDEVVRTWLAV